VQIAMVGGMSCKIQVVFFWFELSILFFIGGVQC
jgi:hypothetical protein